MKTERNTKRAEKTNITQKKESWSGRKAYLLYKPTLFFLHFPHRECCVALKFAKLTLNNLIECQI